HFDQFLSQINDGAPAAALVVGAPPDALSSDREYWRSVQHTLMQTQWERLYRTRAIAVIAMLDPSYPDTPSAAEPLVSTELRPAAAHRRSRHTGSLNQVSSSSRGSKRTAHKKKARAK